MTTNKDYSLVGFPLLPATGAAADPTLFIAILVVATLAIVTGIFLLRRKPPG
jgi:LPXTG-motif cell wall-anchored protein